MAKVHATTSQIIKIGIRLKEVVEVVDGKAVRYNEGWNDNRIAAEVGAQDNHVARIRLELFGVFPRQATARDVMVDRIKVLEERVSKLEGLHAKLCETLTVNRVQNVGHLTGLNSALLSSASKLPDVKGQSNPKR